VLSYTLADGTLGTGSLALTPAIAGQSVRIACNGTCAGLPTTLALPNIAGLSLNAPLAVCVGAPLSLTLLPTGLNLTQAGISVSAATPTGALVVSALGPDGVLTVSGGNLTVGNPTSVTVTVNLFNQPLVSASVNVNVLAQPAAPTQPATLTTTVGSVLSLTGLCPLGTTLTTGPLTGNGIIPVPTVTAGVQSLTVLCSNGTCLSLPTIVNVLVNQPLLNLSAPLAVCVGAPLSLTLLPTGLNLTQAGISVSAATPTGALVVSALGPDGVLTVSGGNLTVGNPTSVTVTVNLFNQPLVSASVNVNVLAQPAAPTQPATLTATVGSVLSLTGLCPVGTVLTTGPLTGNGIIPVPTVSAGVQSLTVLCSNGTCLSLPTIVNVNVVTPIISVSASAAICLGQPLSLTVLPGNFNLADGIVSISVSGPVGLSVGAINSNGVITITGLPAGNQNLTVTASVAGTPLASVQVPVSVNSVQPPTVVTATGGSYPAGVSSLSVTQNTGNVLFTVSCTSGASSYTGTGGITGSGDFSVSTTATGVYNYSVVCTNAPCVSTATVVSVSVVSPANQPPVLTGTPITSPQTATVGVGFSTPTAYAFNDPDGGPLTYTASPLPAGIAINPQTGVISGTASTTVGSPFTVIVTATDPQSASVSTSFVLNVVNPAAVNPGAPFSITSVTTNNCQVISAGERQVTFTPNYAGLNGQTVTFRVVNETMPTTAAGPYTLRLYTDNPTIQLRATQAGSSNEASFSYNWLAACGNTTPTNQPPVLTATGITSPQTATVGVGFSTPTAQAFNDPDGGPLTYTALPLPAGIAINPQTGVISGTASTTVGSPFTVIVTATDPQSASVSTSFVLNVVNPAAVNQPPVLTGTPITSPQTATVGVGFSTPTAQAFNDPDGGPLTYTASPLPTGIAINPQTGVISGTPSTTVGSPFTVIVTATDPQQASVSTSFVLNVVNPTTPTTACGSTNLNGSALQATRPNFTCDQIKASGNIQFTVTGGSASGGVIEFKAIGVTDWTTNCQQIIDRETRTACDAAPIEIQVRQLVNGSYVYGTSYIFDIRRECPIAGCGGLPAPNRAPVVSAGIPNQVATVGQIFKYNIPANAFVDPDGDELLYMSSRLPDSFTFSSGFFGAYPTTAEVLSVTVTAYDNSGGMVSTTFTITVNPNPSTQPPTTPQPPAPTCGSTNLNGSTLQATAPNVNCEQLKSSGNIQFTATGGNPNGGAIEFRAIGVTDWTTNCQQIIDRETRTACDAAPIQIQVRQLVNGSYVYGTSYTFNIRQVCPVAGCGAARVAAEVKAPLDVRVLGNPTREESVSVDIRGAEGQRLQLMVVDTQGFPVSEHTVDSAGTVEHQTVKLGRTAGIYLLRVYSSDHQMQTVKVLKQ